MKEFTETYTVTETKQVLVTAPSTSTEHVYIPGGTMKAEKGMTWAEWVDSSYNTIGATINGTWVYLTGGVLSLAADIIRDGEIYMPGGGGSN